MENSETKRKGGRRNQKRKRGNKGKILSVDKSRMKINTKSKK